MKPKKKTLFNLPNSQYDQKLLNLYQLKNRYEIKYQKNFCFYIKTLYYFCLKKRKKQITIDIT